MDAIAAFVGATVPIVVGAVVLLRSNQRRIGGLLVLQGLLFGLLLLTPLASTGRAGLVVDQLMSGSWVFLFVCVLVIAYLVPDGHPLSPGWRRWMLCGLLGVGAFLVGAAGDADSFRASHDGQDPPLAWLPAALSGALGVLGLALTVLLFLGAALTVRARLRQAGAVERLQLLWLVWGATSIPVALVLAWVGHFALADNAWAVTIALLVAAVPLPMAIGISILRFQLFDIRLVLSRTLTYGVLVSTVIAVYALLLVAAQRLVGSSALGGAVAVGLVAVLVQPAYLAVRRRIERWVYGYRAEPAVALRQLGTKLENADPLQVVSLITESVADALRVDRVLLVRPDEAPPVGPGVVRTPLVHRGERLADLLVQLPPGRRLSAADAALLEDLARYASITVRAAQLAGEVQSSRSLIVTGREEERKRLRRDLHDGVGPLLAAILLKVEAARSRRDPELRDALLLEVRDETKTAIAEVRRAVDELRPPAIDEVGLCAAIRQRANALSTDALTIEVSGPAGQAGVPAAVEVAAYRIACEAMTNVARHSAATACRVELEVDDGVRITVSDNGAGGPTALDPGVGLTSMAERAAELGGTLTVERRVGGGVEVRAVLPTRQTVPVAVAS